jgi:hypothetical protein
LVASDKATPITYCSAVIASVIREIVRCLREMIRLSRLCGGTRAGHDSPQNQSSTCGE